MHALAKGFIIAIFFFSSIKSVKIRTCDNNLLEYSQKEISGFGYLDQIEDEVELPFTGEEFKALVIARKDPLFLEKYFVTAEYASLLKAIDNTRRDSLTEDISLWLKLLPFAFDRRHDYSLYSDNKMKLVKDAFMVAFLVGNGIIEYLRPETDRFIQLAILIGAAILLYQHFIFKSGLTDHVNLCKKNNYWPIVINKKHLRILVADTSPKRLDTILDLCTHLFVNNAAARKVLNGEATEDSFCREKVTSLLRALSTFQVNSIRHMVRQKMLTEHHKG